MRGGSGFDNRPAVSAFHHVSVVPGSAPPVNYKVLGSRSSVNSEVSTTAVFPLSQRSRLCRDLGRSHNMGGSNLVRPQTCIRKGMPIVSILITLVIIGLILWLVTTYIPMAPPVRTVLTVVVVLLLCLWLASTFGLLDYTVPIHRARL